MAPNTDKTKRKINMEGSDEDKSVGFSATFLKAIVSKRGFATIAK